jgi:phage terminase large subunit-like protein
MGEVPRELRAELLVLLEERARRLRQRKFWSLFPDADTVQPDGSIIHARDSYPRHIEFFDAGRTYRERCFLAGNRVGKTLTGAYETVCHLTGLYPDWWTGKRFDCPVRFWVAGKTNETTRDILQSTLMGEIITEDGRKAFTGTGVVPGRLVGGLTWKQGVADLADTVKVKHASGQYSTLGFKSYQQGRGSFEGTAQHGIWMDEEPPLDVYGEALIRTATTNGIVMLTFTPLEGLSETVLQFMPQEMQPGG